MGVDEAGHDGPPAEIDALGMTRALRLAGTRALAQLSVRPDVVILDGKVPHAALIELFTDTGAGTIIRR